MEQFSQNREKERWGKSVSGEIKTEKGMSGEEEGEANGLIQREQRRRRVALAVAGHGCRRGDCGMQLKLA